MAARSNGMSVKNPGAAYGLALDRLHIAEARLRRAFHAWEKCRAALIRCEQRLDDAQRASGAPA